MDHIGIIKRAWHITWHYRILWLFGLFAGGMSAGGGGTGGNVSFPWAGDATSVPATPGEELQQAMSWLQHNLVLVFALLFFLVLVGMVFLVLGIAAKGGLIHLVNEAEEGRPVRGVEGWAAGFGAWFRVLGIALVLYVPFTLVLLLIFAATFAPLLSAVFTGSEPGAEAFVGLCGGLVLGIIVAMVGGILLGMLDELAIRHAVLDRSSVSASITAAWRDVRTGFKDVIIIWLLLIGVGIAFGLAAGLMAAMFAFAIALAVVAHLFVVAGAIGIALLVALLLPGAIFNTFVSAIWTVFFRRLTGRDAAMATVLPSPPIAPEQAYAYPTP